MENYYKTLRISPNANFKEIRKGYQSLALNKHPDVNQNQNAHEEFIAIVEAYEVLKSPIRKRQYDVLLKIYQLKNKSRIQNLSAKKADKFQSNVSKAQQRGNKKGKKYSQETVKKLSKRNALSDVFSGLSELLDFIIRVFEIFN